MLRIGVVGIGFMGLIHYLAYRKVRGAKVAAICTRDARRRAGDWRGIQGNFGPPGEVMDLSGLATYEHLEQLLDDPQIDVVDLCLPPNKHAAAAIAALKAGKHVICEKPIALKTSEARSMVAAAKSAKKQLLIAHVLPFVGEFAVARQAVESGKYGRLLGGHFKRVIADPRWLPQYYDPGHAGGPMIDLHVHDAHFIRLMCGMPTRVFTSGRMRGDVAEFFTSHFQFADPTLAVTATSGVIRQQGRSFTHAYELHLEQATLLFDFAVIDGQATTFTPATILTSTGKVQRPKIRSTDPVDPFIQELTEAVRAITSGEASPLLDGQLASDALRICQAETQSLMRSKPVKVA